MKLRLALLCGAALTFAAQSSFADFIAFTPNAGVRSTDLAGQGLVGFKFTLNQNINLTQLGFYALNLGGGDTPHVALLNITGGATNPPTVLFDTGNMLPGGLTNDSMNFVSVGAPIPLTTGNTYEITAPLYWSPSYSSNSGFSLGGAIATASYMKGGGWTNWDPTNGNPTQNYDYTTQTDSTAGPFDVSANFQYTLAAVPEPASLGLLALGGLAMLARRRRA